MPTASTGPSRPVVHSGGCQCGRVRYELHAEPTHASICHCRMCQKAFGNYFAPFATIKVVDMSWTTVQPAVFMSSEIVERGFCSTCGTPLSFRFTDRQTISVSIGSLDAPDRIRPTQNIGTEGRLAWLSGMLAEGGSTTEARVTPERMALLVSRQHSDGA